MSEHEEAREALRSLIELDIVATASGHKSSEGDGRTAADIERELKEARDGSEQHSD